jgi:hypothetical protein
VSAVARLAGFAAGLAVVFGAAALAGSRLDVHPGTTATAAGAHAMGRDEPAAPAVRGLGVSDAGLTLQLARTAAPRSARFDLVFRVVDRRGRTQRDFDVPHEKRMHLIVVRRDTTAFQHVHPTQRADGTWSVPLTLRDAGSYRVFADFSVDGRPRTLAADLGVDGAQRSRPLPAPSTTAGVDGLRVSLAAEAATAGAESELAFTVTRGGRRVAVEPFLGARGHLVALREGDLAFLHVHPDEDRPTFTATFPTAGTYRLVLQFRAEGRLHTAAFTLEVAR